MYQNFGKKNTGIDLAIFSQTIQEITQVDLSDQVDHFLFNKQDLFQWTVLLHNIVNKSLGKKEWGFKEAWDHYNTFSYHKEAAEASSSSNNMSIYNEKNILLMILICVIVLLTIWCLIMKK